MLYKGTKAPYELISPVARELLKGEYGAPRKSISARVPWVKTQTQGALGALDNSGSLGPRPRFCRRLTIVTGTLKLSKAILLGEKDKHSWPPRLSIKGVYYGLSGAAANSFALKNSTHLVVYSRVSRPDANHMSGLPKVKIRLF